MTFRSVVHLIFLCKFQMGCPLDGYIYILYIYKTSGAHNESANIEIRETDFRSISNLAEYDHRFIIER